MGGTGRLCCGILFLCLFSVLSSIPGAPRLSAARAENQKTVLVGVYENAPKIFTSESGKPSGIFADIIEDIAASAGWNLQYVSGTWGEGLDRLEKGEIDLMPDVAYTVEREKRFSFHKEPVLSSWSQVYAPKGSGIKSILDLNGKCLAVLERSVQQEVFLRLAAGFNVNTAFISTPDYKTMFEMVSRGEADAAITNRFYGLMHGKEIGLEGTSIIFDPSDLVYAATRGDPKHLLTSIDDRLSDLKKDPQSVYYSSLKRWTSEEVRYNLPVWLQILGLVVGIALLMSLGGSFVLKHQVNARTRQLRQINQQMEQRIVERTAELAAAMEKAQAADRIKSAFLATMSHEIRTPMNAILGFTQLLLRDSEVQPKHRTSLETVKRSGEYLLKLLNDVLEMSKVEAGRTTLREGVCDLHALMRDLEGMFCALTMSKGLSLETAFIGAVPRLIWTDEQKLRQIVNNLLGNAVKFTEKGGIILRVKAAAEEKPPQEMVEPAGRRLRLVFEVEDTGPGVAEADRQRIFSHFEQLTTVGRMKGGSGLGLAISEAYVELMGGTISVGGRVGDGSVFRFDILTVEVGEESSPAVPTERHITGLKAGQREFRILVADDNEANREILVKLLESVGFLVRESADGREACREFAAWHPDLILMDLVMPVMDGFEAIREIRAASEGKEIPVIAVSASVLEEDQRRVMSTGADAFLQKPFTEEEVFGLIGKCLGVQYVHADEPVEPSPVIREAEGIAPFLLDQLPDSLVAGLREAAISLDVERLEELLPQVAECDAGSAGRFQELIDDYDFKALQDLLKKDKGHRR